jgi:myosin heavy subunit
MAKYQQQGANLEGLMTGDGLEPHVFTVAHAAYHKVRTSPSHYHCLCA